MDSIYKCLEDIKKINEEAKKKLDEAFLPYPKDGVIYVPKGFKWESTPHLIDLKSNVTIAKWWHFQWFLNLQVKLFGKVII